MRWSRSGSLCLPCLGSTASFQDAKGEDGHDGGADEAGDGHRHKPGHEDISEQEPVDRLPRTQPPNRHNRAHLKQSTSSTPLKFTPQSPTLTAERVGLQQTVCSCVGGGGHPTLQWVVETGRPMLEATTTVRAEASSMLKPLQENLKKKKKKT